MIVAIKEAEEKLSAQFARLEEIACTNQKRVLDAFKEHRVTEEHFAERTGYGIDDHARELLDKIFASVFESEAAAVRMQIVSGTHALACALLGNLQSGERMVCLTGTPYDTLDKVIGHRHHESGSLVASGVQYVEADVCSEGVSDGFNAQPLAELLKPPTRMAYIQKSCGYSFERRTLKNADIEKLAAKVHAINPTCIVMVDNCYGEFVEDHEPTAIGADLVAGSLIKNPGGGLAITGGYIAGKKQLVEAALRRLTAPGIDGHLGIMFNQNRLLLQGLFLAPTVVFNAVKGALLVAQVFSELGYEVKPAPDEARADIIQAIKFGGAEALTAFLKAIQQNSPVNSHVTPEPALMPGYEDQVIMAGGTFIEGSTIEFSADGPLRPPYVAFVQGGLTYFHVKCALAGALEAMAARV
ncbi:MAG TPA: methionine gamma-lyase family protein [Candidatus Obscuribacterales bacterium]